MPRDHAARTGPKGPMPAARNLNNFTPQASPVAHGTGPSSSPHRSLDSPPLVSVSHTITRVILSAEEMRRAIARIAHEILERTDGAQDVLLVGLYAEGIPLAERLAAFIRAFEQREVPVGRLDFSNHRDDVRDKGPFPALGPTVLPDDLADMTVVLVDDVLYTGRSMRAALDALLAHGRPARVQCAVLIDRGHRELPIRADYVGKNVPTGGDEWVEVQLTELHGQDRVLLMREGGKR
jgi:pyrimidine operon attenuation protein / uracil phosphoribosyltransferase